MQAVSVVECDIFWQSVEDLYLGCERYLIDMVKKK